MTLPIRVMKFGGASIADIDSIQNVLSIINVQQKQYRLVLVFSAMGKTTARLLEAGQLAARGEWDNSQKMLGILTQHHLSLCEDLFTVESPCCTFVRDSLSSVERQLQDIANTGSLSLKSQDHLLAFGELMATAIMTEALKLTNVSAVLLDARELFLTDSRFTRAEPERSVSFHNIRSELGPMLAKDLVPVVQGFIGRNKAGDTTTFGFEGSDYTASLLGAALSAEAIDVWKDVPGVMSTDPHQLSDAVLIPELTYDEAAAMTYMGAKVLHAKTLGPARACCIPIHVRPLADKTGLGSRVGVSASEQGGAVIGITALRKPVHVTVTGHDHVMPHQLFDEVSGLFHELQIQPVLLSLSGNRVVAVVSHHFDLIHRLQDLSQWGAVQVDTSLTAVSLVGHNLVEAPDILRESLAVLSDEAIAFVSTGVSPHLLTIGLPEAQRETAVQKLHSHFFKTQGET